ncbi:PREDICTED: floral homeotic protein PISTILLATA-like isoform X2 [Brassica oleracea var. oleracea]|uniref:floral homeotic protein PISTILLATA-like isoform X2 n=1 Tax=Brassica oleracea var. oleracea TaxID=109376 RepID=UPI0006A714C5|nr:PREDICTED: floral homeotic protein PISTILLATA-like isoform X2 [Brassica oleracea var. oleracea]
MGRGKIEIKRIENANNRVVTFSKRRNGLVKKAKEITVLCDAKVALIVFASNGKMTDYCCPSMDLGAMLDQYQKLSGKKLWDAKHENLSNEIDMIKKENDSLQLELRKCEYRHLKGEDIQSLNLKNLMGIEHAIEHGLDKVRDHQMEFLMTKRRNEKMLVEENRQLSFQLQQQEMAIASNARGMMMRDQDGQFGYRVQPTQPNLQEKIMSLVID